MKLNTRVARRKLRIRSTLHSKRMIPYRPRLSVFRSSAHIWAQIIDDTSGKTIVAINDHSFKGNKTEKSKQVGTTLATSALLAKCTKVVFDRGSYRYHGRVKALADAAREAGLQF